MIIPPGPGITFGTTTGTTDERSITTPTNYGEALVRIHDHIAIMSVSHFGHLRRNRLRRRPA